MILSIPRAAFDTAKDIADEQERNHSAAFAHLLYQEPLPNAAIRHLAAGTYQVFLQATMEELQELLRNSHGAILLSGPVSAIELEVRLAKEPKGASKE